MKTKIILLTHGGWGEELLQSAQMVVGKIECCETLSLMPEDSISNYMQRIDAAIENAENVLPGSTAAADVRQTPTISMVPLRTLMISAARCRRRESSVRL